MNSGGHGAALQKDDTELSALRPRAGAGTSATWAVPASADSFRKRTRTTLEGSERLREALEAFRSTTRTALMKLAADQVYDESGSERAGEVRLQRVWENIAKQKITGGEALKDIEMADILWDLKKYSDFAKGVRSAFEDDVSGRDTTATLLRVRQEAETRMAAENARSRSGSGPIGTRPTAEISEADREAAKLSDEEVERIFLLCMERRYFRKKDTVPDRTISERLGKSPDADNFIRSVVGAPIKADNADFAATLEYCFFLLGAEPEISLSLMAADERPPVPKRGTKSAEDESVPLDPESSFAPLQRLTQLLIERFEEASKKRDFQELERSAEKLVLFERLLNWSMSLYAEEAVHQGLLIVFRNSVRQVGKTINKILETAQKEGALDRMPSLKNLFRSILWLDCNMQFFHMNTANGGLEAAFKTVLKPSVKNLSPAEREGVISLLDEDERDLATEFFGLTNPQSETRRKLIGALHRSVTRRFAGHVATAREVLEKIEERIPGEGNLVKRQRWVLENAYENGNAPKIQLSLEKALERLDWMNGNAADRESAEGRDEIERAKSFQRLKALQVAGLRLSNRHEDANALETQTEERAWMETVVRSLYGSAAGQSMDHLSETVYDLLHHARPGTISPEALLSIVRGAAIASRRGTAENAVTRRDALFRLRAASEAIRHMNAIMRDLNASNAKEQVPKIREIITGMRDRYRELEDSLPGSPFVETHAGVYTELSIFYKRIIRFSEKANPTKDEAEELEEWRRRIALCDLRALEMRRGTDANPEYERLILWVLDTPPWTPEGTRPDIATVRETMRRTIYNDLVGAHTGEDIQTMLAQTRDAMRRSAGYEKNVLEIRSSAKAAEQTADAEKFRSGDAYEEYLRNIFADMAKNVFHSLVSDIRIVFTGTSPGHEDRCFFEPCKECKAHVVRGLGLRRSEEAKILYAAGGTFILAVHEATHGPQIDRIIENHDLKRPIFNWGSELAEIRSGIDPDLLAKEAFDELERSIGHSGKPVEVYFVVGGGYVVKRKLLLKRAGICAELPPIMRGGAGIQERGELIFANPNGDSPLDDGLLRLLTLSAFMVVHSDDPRHPPLVARLGKLDQNLLFEDDGIGTNQKSRLSNLRKPEITMKVTGVMTDMERSRIMLVSGADKIPTVAVSDAAAIILGKASRAKAYMADRGGNCPSIKLMGGWLAYPGKPTSDEAKVFPIVSVGEDEIVILIERELLGSLWKALKDGLLSAEMNIYGNRHRWAEVGQGIIHLSGSGAVKSDAGTDHALVAIRHAGLGDLFQQLLRGFEGRIRNSIGDAGQIGKFDLPESFRKKELPERRTTK